MSFIKDFWSNIATTMDRNRLMDSVESTREMLTNDTLPPFKEAMEYGAFKGVTPFKSTPIRNFNNVFMREVDARRNWIESDTIILSRLVNEFAELSEAVEKHFAQRNSPRLAMTYQQLTFMRLIELVRFCGRYSRRMLHYTYACETPAEFSKVSVANAIPKGERKWLEENAVGYCRSMKMLSMPMKEILKQIQGMPDTVYDPEQEDAVASVVGARKIDPLALGYIPVISALFWSLGSRWVEWQAAELQEARAERELVQLYLAQLKAARNGDFDAATEKVIKVQEDRLNDLTYEIVKLSKRYGVDPNG